MFGSGVDAKNCPTQRFPVSLQVEMKTDNKKPSAINIIWLGMIVISTVTAGYTGRMDEVTRASFDYAKSAVTLAIGLIGPMALWLGIMKVAEAGGLMKAIARAVRPVMLRLFPDVPHDHPAMSAMIMNMAANALGLGNAATPMGIKAMQELDTLVEEKGTASDAMCLFLAINTSSVTLLPLGVITVRAAAGATHPASILIPSIIATCCSTCVAVIAAKFFAARSPDLVAKIRRKNGMEDNVEGEKRGNNEIRTPDRNEAESNAKQTANTANGDQVDQEGITGTKKIEHNGEKVELTPPGPYGRLFIGFLAAAFLGAIVYRLMVSPPDRFFSTSTLASVTKWMIPLLIAGLLTYGYLKGVKVYETLTSGAVDGFKTAVRIIPFMVAIFVAIGMFRASGALDLLVRFLSPATELIGMPAEALTVAFMRPLSGTGSFGVMSEIVYNSPDSFLSSLVSTMQGSTETTFYVLAVYFGSVGIRRTRHALPSALLADATGIIAAVLICRIWF